MIYPEQSRAARAWLSWGQQELADRAKISLSTVRDFELGKRKPIRNNLDAMQAALEHGGLRFLFTDEGEAAGIALGDTRTPLPQNLNLP